MDRREFEREILGKLESHSRSGDITNQMGTRLIGHTPEIAPKAYQHIVYAPLDESQLGELEERLNRPVHFKLKQLLAIANGMIVFSGELRVMGYVPVKREAESRIHNYPPCIISRNVSGRMKGLRERAVIVGFYQSDGSYVSIEFDGTVVRFDAKGDGRALRKWQDIDDWLISEVSRLAREYEANESA
jgi:hypothetical protein